MLEIPLSDGSIIFPQFEISSKKFLLNSLESYKKLEEALSEWIKESEPISDHKYQTFLHKRLKNQKKLTELTSYNTKTSKPVNVSQKLNTLKNICNPRVSFDHKRNKKSVDIKNMSLFEFLDMNRGIPVNNNNKNKSIERGTSYCANETCQIKKSNSLSRGYSSNSWKKNMAPNPKKSSKTDIFFRGDKFGNLEEWSISESELKTDWGQIHKEPIKQIKPYSNGKNLLTLDQACSQKVWSTKTKRLIWDFGKTHTGWLGSQIILENDLYAFTAGESGCFKQWSLVHHRMWKDCTISTKENIHSLVATPNSSYVFIGSGDLGNLKQFSVQDRTVIKEFRKIHNGKIHTMAVTPNSEWLFTTGEDGSQKQWNIPQGVQLYKNYGRVHRDWISGIDITSDNKYQITSTGNWGDVKLWKFKDFVFLFL